MYVFVTLKDMDSFQHLFNFLTQILKIKNIRIFAKYENLLATDLKFAWTPSIPDKNLLFHLSSPLVLP